MNMFGSSQNNQNQVSLEEIRSMLTAKKNQKLMFMLVNDGRDIQFRCWEGIFNRYRPGFVDSMGKNLVFTIFGEASEVRALAQTLIPSGYQKWDHKQDSLWTP